MGTRTGIEVILRRIRYCLAAASLFLVVLGSGCAPTARSLAIADDGMPALPSWQQIRVGSSMHIWTRDGGEFEGCVVAVGDSVSLAADQREPRGTCVIARADIAKADVRPPMAPGERVISFLLGTVVVLMGLLIVFPPSMG